MIDSHAAGRTSGSTARKVSAILLDALTPRTAHLTPRSDMIQPAEDTLTRVIIMRYVLTPIGSGGDVRPFILIGGALRRRGHEVTLLASEPFGPQALDAGIDFVSVWSSEEYERNALDPDLWNPRRGVELVMRILGSHLQDAWELLDRVVEPGRTVLVGHSLSFAARSFAEKRRIPNATIHLQPNVFRSRHEQAVVVPGVDLNRLPSFLIDPFWRVLDHFLIDPSIAPALNRWRASHDLPPVKRVFDQWLHAPQLVLAMFPEWFARPQPDWPPQTRLVGFPVDKSAKSGVDEDLDSWLLEGDPPLVFTPGTANRQAAGFFSAAVGASRRLGRRALLLTRWQEQLPAVLPAGIRHEGFAPLAAILHRCAAFIHHGGIGSCADGFAAGVPQLLMPMAFDQPDNARRVARIGTGSSLSPKKFSADRVAGRLRELLGDEGVSRACRRISRCMMENDGVEGACNALEGLRAP